LEAYKKSELGGKMSITCPKCGYIRKPEDEAPNYECPRCGIVYAKVLSRLQDTKPQEFTRKKSPTTDSLSGHGLQNERRQKQVLVAAVITSFIVGYFAGREHLKYEMRSAIENATAGLRNAFGGGGNQPAAKPPTPKVTQASPITATLLRKRWLERDYGRSEITFAVTFANSTGKDVRAFDGLLIFTDLLGNEIHSAKLAINDPVQSGQSLEWEGKLDYNQFMAPHERLRNIETENTKIVFVLKKVLFADGQVKEY
jgi:predicted RNA-binding Zn-ribbon protein involved in translation (DUF1610 family)